MNFVKDSRIGSGSPLTQKEVEEKIQEQLQESWQQVKDDAERMEVI